MVDPVEPDVRVVGVDEGAGHRVLRGVGEGGEEEGEGEPPPPHTGWEGGERGVGDSTVRRWGEGRRFRGAGGGGGGGEHRGGEASQGGGGGGRRDVEET